MTVIARDAVASDHLVYSWPFPIGPECEVACGDDEQVVMCPAWMVGDRLGPGRHRWRTPDPTRPVGAFFVLTAPVEVSFDMVTSFMLPSTHQGIRLRASGSLQVRCADPGLLIAQFVGLPFDSVNEGVLRSVSRSVERMLARLLTRRVVMSGTPMAVTDPSQLAGIVEELVAYNPTAGAVFGVELIRMGHLAIGADDGSTPYVALPSAYVNGNGNGNGNGHAHRPPDADTARGPAAVLASAEAPPIPSLKKRAPTAPTIPPDPRTNVATTSGEINTIRTKQPSEPPASRHAGPMEIPQTSDEITQPGVDTQRLLTPVPGAMRAPTPQPNPAQSEARGSILGIGMGAIGHSAVAGEIPTKVPPGGRVLVPGPNGLMQSATVRQLLQGYYELEVGSSGQTIWVPINGVVPE